MESTNDKIRNSRRRRDPCVRARQPRIGAGGHLQSWLLRAVLSKRQLPEPGTGKPLHGGGYQRQAYQDQAYQDRTWRNSYNRWDDNSGFWPGDVAAGVVGGAVGTAAAVAAYPIGGEEYARRNGFVCVPGTLFRGEDGRRHLCQ